MFLNKIEIKGFKSFADRIEIDFISGITCIVGPNGSGKSNITDSIRWVLGEQKTSLLRGSKMQDLIFSGTEHRKPLNFAEVALFFDNSTNFFKSDFLEISVKRRLHRSGESEYFINEAPCRLKDVKELIMDTGIGTDGYSIIGQGNIDSILSDNKFDRRQIFEEAAGIVKFNSKKNESVKRLVKVEDNMDRINDIIREVESRIEPLREESEKAKEFLSIEKKVRDSELKYLLDEYDNYKSSSDEAQNEKASSEIKLSELSKEKAQKENDQISLQIEIRQLKELLEGLDLQFSHLSKERDELNLDVKVREEKLSTRKNDIENLTRSKENELKHFHFVGNEIAESKTQLKAMNSRKDQLIEELEALSQEFIDSNEQYRLLNSDKDELIKQLATYHSQLEAFRSEKSKALEYIEKLTERFELTSRDEYEATQTLNQTQTQLKINKETKEKYESLIEKNSTILKIKEEDRDQLEDALYEIKGQLEEKNRLKYRTESEIELLDNLEKNFEGVQGYMKRILKYLEVQKLTHKTKGIVADLLTIPNGYEDAIATALGKSSTQIVTSTENDAKELIYKLKKDNVGRATFLPLNFLKSRNQSIQINEPGFLGFGKDIVQYDKEYATLVDYLLGKVIIARNIDDAINISKSVKGYFKIVTLDGDVIITNGPITGGSKSKSKDNIFKRKQDLVRLNKQLKNLTLEVKTLKNGVNQKEEKIEILNDEIDSLKKELIENRSLDMTSERDYQVLVNKLEIDNKQMEQAKQSRLSYETDLERERLSLSVIDDAVKDIDFEKKKIESIISDTSVNSVDEVFLKELEKKMTDCKINQAKLEENIKNTISSIADKEITIDTLNQDIEGIEIKMQESNALMADEIDLLDHKRNALGDINLRLKLHEEKRGSSRQSLNHNESMLENIFEEQKQVENSINSLRQKIHELEIEMAKLDIKISNLSNKLWENFELSIVEARNQIIEVEEFISKIELKKLRKRLKEIEHVNLNSIKEYEEVKERHEFLSTQMGDLNDSKEELEKFIRQMERKIVKSFKETFEEINESFKYVFSELFGGGHGEIEMADPDDILGTDINIMASPPGKKMKNINLLSGGEKALTAIALLFAVLKAKPTPFCILDEIEAALDDSNVYKFGQFLREFSKESQFILITHRKGTMEYADALYGVSMEEYGVSKIISIKLSDYIFEEEVNDQELIQ